jgi:hypothetical protein
VAIGRIPDSKFVVNKPETTEIITPDNSKIRACVPNESSGDRRRLRHISKQGNVLLRFLLVEAAQVTVHSQQEWRNKFFHLAMRRGRKRAKVAPDIAMGVQSVTDVMIGHPAPRK